MSAAKALRPNREALGLFRQHGDPQSTTPEPRPRQQAFERASAGLLLSGIALRAAKTSLFMGEGNAAVCPEGQTPAGRLHYPLRKARTEGGLGGSQMRRLTPE
ncbi:hypothetical protein BAUCODRAFT_124100 [Baudoinia panamericana UAMH 10762]|uniref:Uncharacterized protein n=1 Tax=Baudoinia panamericana (strain UAMH 10762) TaxID=717646 RepID=M2MD86_BAUPA|nr:uncharacterized protein BAUCODRAFT_124100 [Baudoinia panamericana UAMH 10762]EMC94481.1 hypothetical protein BAUCODRAFT_124100 [Baudoinia panamericana UAMH 10762]